MLATLGGCWVSAHDRPLAVGELEDAVAGADADALVCLLHDQIDERVLQAAGAQLRIVANVAVGYDNVDVAACRRHRVEVTNTPGVLTEPTADLTFALILAVTRRVGEAERFVRSGSAWSWHMDFMLGTGLQGKTLGIVGLGAIGRAVARRAHAFGMSVVYAAPRRASQEHGALHVTLDELLATADIVSPHCPLLSATQHRIGAAALARMKRTAYLINTARGPIVDESVLVAALADGTIAGAGLDVFEDEPAVHPGLLKLEHTVLLPHIGSATVEARTAMAVLAAQNVAAVLGGDGPLTPV